MIQINRYSKVGAVLALILSVFLSMSYAYAYDIERIPSDEVIGDFVVGPGKVEVSLQPGESVTREMIVTNRMGEDKRFEVEVEDVRGSNDPNETVVLLGTDQGPYSLRDYISVPEWQFDLGHAERARIPVTISIPEDAEPGGFYGVVLIKTISKPNVGDGSIGAQGGAVIESRIGTLFFVTVPGEVERDAELIHFSTIPDKSVFFNGPIQFQLLFENRGSVHVNPYGGIRIRNMFGQEVGAVGSDPWYSFPDSVRLRELVWDRPYLFGYYTATAEVNRGYDDIIDTKTISFVVLPWKPIALGVGVLFVLFFLIRTFFRTFEFKRKSSTNEHE